MEVEFGRIDVHHHILPEEYLSKLKSINVTQAGGIPFPAWNPQMSMEFMQKFGIQKAIVSISSPGVYFGNRNFASQLARLCNDYMIDLITEHPNQFGAFAGLPLPDIEASIREIKYSLDELKLDGISLLSNYEGMFIGEPKFNAILQELNKRKARVFLHPNAPYITELSHGRAASIEFVFDTTRAIGNILHNKIPKKYPEIKFIFAHAGGTAPFIAWRMVFGNTNLLDYLKSFYYDLALSSSPNVLSCLKEFVDSSHLLYGSDFPFLPERLIARLADELAQYHRFDENTKENIQRHNAIKLFSN